MKVGVNRLCHNVDITTLTAFFFSKGIWNFALFPPWGFCWVSYWFFTRYWSDFVWYFYPLLISCPVCSTRKMYWTKNKSNCYVYFYKLSSESYRFPALKKKSFVFYFCRRYMKWSPLCFLGKPISAVLTAIMPAHFPCPIPTLARVPDLSYSN